MTPVILGTAATGLLLIKRLDRDIEPPDGIKACLLAAGVAGGALLEWIYGPGEFLSRLPLAMLLGCLLLACATDVVICQVYNLVWWIGGAASAMLLWRRLWLSDIPEDCVGILIDLTVFCVIQLKLFGRLYGKADCYAFCVCAVAGAGIGMRLELFMTHMAMAFVLLVPVQFSRRNIGTGGKLKEPVPFLPYITAAFYLLMIFVKICGEIVVPLS